MIGNPPSGTLQRILPTLGFSRSLSFYMAYANGPPYPRIPGSSQCSDNAGVAGVSKFDRRERPRHFGDASKMSYQPNRSFADHLILNADHLLDVFGSLLMLALSKENWDTPFTGIWSIPHSHCLAYRDSFPSCSRRSAVCCPNILDWLQNKPDRESCQRCAGPLVSLLNPAVPGNLPFGSLLASSICRQSM